MALIDTRPFRLVSQAGEIAYFAYDVFRKLFKPQPHQGLLTRQILILGAESVPLIVITGLFTGMVLAVQTYSQLHRLGAETLVGPIVGVGMVSELGPVLACLMLSSRVGGAMAAELGTMQVTEQVDALRIFGTDPVHYLVVPRFLACLIIAPLLTLMADIVGVCGGYFMCVNVYGIDSYYFIEKTRIYLDNWNIFTGFAKAFMFGLVIAICCCWRGLVTRGGAQNVGRATTQANVLAAVGILITNFFLTMILNSVYLKWII